MEQISRILSDILREITSFIKFFDKPCYRYHVERLRFTPLDISKEQDYLNSFGTLGYDLIQVIKEEDVKIYYWKTKL